MSEEGGGPPRIGLRVGWLVFALLTLALVVSGGFIAADRINRPVAGQPTVPPMLGGAGSVGPSPSSATQIPAVEPPGQRNSVAGVGNVRTIVCDDTTASVSGVHNTVTITGNCTRVDVSGVENMVTIESAGAITVSGIGNRVEFLSGSPELSRSGIDNTLERG